MRYSFFFIFVCILGLLQFTFLNEVAIFGLKPDLLLIFVVIVTLFLDFKWAITLSLFAGLFKDVFISLSFGLNSALFLLWSFLIWKISHQLSLHNTYLRLTLVFILSIFHNTAVGLLSVYLSAPIPMGIFLRIAFIGSLYTALIFPFLLLVSKSLYNRLSA